MNSFESFSSKNADQLAKNKKIRERERMTEEIKRVVEDTDESILNIPEVKKITENAGKRNVTHQSEKANLKWTHRAEKRELQKNAEVDSLTGLANRRGFESYINKKQYFIEKERDAAGSERRAPEDRENLFSVFMIDLDKFKNINDTYGHETGDKVLEVVAQTLQERLRSSKDMVARWGGEEFMVAVEDSEDDVVLIADRLRQAIEDIDMEYNNHKIPITASIGVSAYSEKTNDMYVMADRALYLAKGNIEKAQNDGMQLSEDMLTRQDSRNRVCYFDDKIGEHVIYEHEKFKKNDVTNEFLTMSSVEFNSFLRKAKDIGELHVKFDWTDVQTARKAKAFLENGSSNQKRSVIIRATRADYEQEVNVFDSGVKWEEIK